MTTKLPAECKGYDIAKKCFEESLSDLGLGYIDLYLIHAPWPWDKMGMDCTEGNIESWKYNISRKSVELLHCISQQSLQHTHHLPTHL